MFTAHNFYELKREAKETLDFHLEGMKEDGDEVPAWLESGEYEFKFQYSDFASFLKAYSDLVPLVSLSLATGINQNQLSHYANGIKKPRQEQRERIVAGMHKIGRELMAVV